MMAITFRAQRLQLFLSKQFTSKSKLVYVTRPIMAQNLLTTPMTTDRRHFTLGTVRVITNATGWSDGYDKLKIFHHREIL